MKSTKEIIKKILLEQAPSEAEEYSPPEGPHNDYYDVGLALRRIVVNKDTGEWLDTDYLEEESIQTSWDLKDAEQIYQKKLYELKFFDTKGKENRFPMDESRDYSDKEQVKEMIADNLTNEIISMLDYSDTKLTYEDLNDILTNVFENAEFLFMDDDSFTLTEQREYTDDHYEYRQTSITRRRLESIIRAEIREQMRRGRELNNPHLNEDIVRVAQRILHQMEENLSYFGENYEGELDDLFNGTVD
mgnify:CR=1 FL=1|tara:strand:+ start:2013 stop:2750 length:738 start_codon:yes stop_codon:yes gene_type:complete